MTLKYSANVGFLWDHLPLPERINAAAAAGFDAVECHFPYEHPADEVLAVLQANNLPMVGINTVLSPPGEGYFGVAAVAGKEALAKGYIDQAIQYAVAIGAKNVNVVAGASNKGDTSETVYQENLTYACQQAAPHGITIVIEPLNPRAVADYHFSRVDQAVSTLKAVGEDNIKLMFDCFHAQIVEGDLATLLQDNLAHIAHIQISAVHDRGEPNEGEINYPYVLELLDKMGYSGYIGAEYKPRGESVESGLAWLEEFRQL